MGAPFFRHRRLLSLPPTIWIHPLINLHCNVGGTALPRSSFPALILPATDTLSPTLTTPPRLHDKHNPPDSSAPQPMFVDATQQRRDIVLFDCCTRTSLPSGNRHRLPDVLLRGRGRRPPRPPRLPRLLLLALGRLLVLLEVLLQGHALHERHPGVVNATDASAGDEGQRAQKATLSKETIDRCVRTRGGRCPPPPRPAPPHLRPRCPAPVTPTYPPTDESKQHESDYSVNSQASEHATSRPIHFTSNMASLSRFSRMERSPRAPVCRRSACRRRGG